MNHLKILHLGKGLFSNYVRQKSVLESVYVSNKKDRIRRKIKKERKQKKDIKKERKQRKYKGGKNTEKREIFLCTPGENVFLLENIVRGQHTVEEYEKVVSSRPEGAKYY